MRHIKRVGGNYKERRFMTAKINKNVIPRFY